MSTQGTSAGPSATDATDPADAIGPDRPECHASRADGRTARPALLDRPAWGWLRADPIGLGLATVFALISMTPSLIPRDYLFQGLVSGISASFGYAFGVMLSWLIRRTDRWDHASDRYKRVAPVWMDRSGWTALLIAVPVALLVMLIAGARWQRQLAALVGLDQTTTGGWLRAGPVMVVVALLLISVGRGIRILATDVAAFLRRRAHMSRALAAVVGTALVLVVMAVLVNSVVLRGALSMADSAFSDVNAQTYPGVVPPTSPMRSGSRDSLVGWDTLGKEGQDFVAGGRPAAQLAAASGRAPVDPVRAYVGLESAATPQERADLAVAELDRTGAFARPVLAVVTTTGTGWIDDPVSDSLELAYGGNTAMVATQYSYLPSWLSFLVDRSRAEEAGRLLFDAVHARVQQLPPDRRPRVLAFGESLGSQGSEAAFSSVGDARAQSDGVLWVGPPNSNRLWGELVASRDAGSPEVAPIVEGGSEVRFGAGPAELDRRPPTPWTTPRVLYVQHPSDPVVWWSPDLLWRRPDWLVEARGSDVLPAMSWFPVITFWQVTIDMTNAQSVPDGHGHNYRSVMLDGWLEIAPPPGWSSADTDRVRGILGP